LDLQLACTTKIAVGSCPWTDWRPFEIWLSITWNAPNFDHTYLGIPNVKPIGSFTKTKEATSSQIFYPFWTIGAQYWPSKSKVPLPQYKMKQIGRLLRQSLLDWKMEKMKET
jgi:hypothetical protein